MRNASVRHTVATLHTNRPMTHIHLCRAAVVIVAVLLSGCQVTAPATNVKTEQSTASTITMPQTPPKADMVAAPTAASNPNYPEQEGRLVGYHIKQEWQGFGDRKVSCDALVITEIDKPYNQAWRTLIDEGNNINKVNASGQLVVNIDTTTTDASVLEAIRAANMEQPVALRITGRREKRMGIPECYTLFDVVGLQR